METDTEQRAERDGAPPRIATADAVERTRAGIATKLLAAWLANRHQTLIPHTLNFRALAGPQVAVLIAVMAAAAQADGAVGAAERRQAVLALRLVNADAAETARHAAALDEGQPLSRILADARREQVATHAYAAALLAIDRTSGVGRAFLAYAAACLALPPDLTRALESRYRA